MTAAPLDREVPPAPVGQQRLSLRVDGRRPVTLNVERQGNRFKRADLVRWWRDAFGWEARSLADRPTFTSVEIVVVVYLRTRVAQDTGGAMPAAKAAIDGLVDAGVLPGDGPDVVRSLQFLAPIHGEGDGLELIVVGEVA